MKNCTPASSAAVERLQCTSVKSLVTRDRQHRSAAGAPPRTPPGPGETYNAAQTPVAGGKGQPAQGSAPPQKPHSSFRPFGPQTAALRALLLPCLVIPPLSNTLRRHCTPLERNRFFF